MSLLCDVPRRVVYAAGMVVLGLIIAIPTAVAQTVDTVDTLPQPPRIGSIRHDEDYSYLRNPRNRSGVWWERFKFIPLDSAAWAYLTVGDEERVRYERYWNNAFGSAVKPDEDYLRYRALPYADLHVGPHFRVFGQLQGAWSTRSELTKSPLTDETGLDLVQGFADVILPRSEEHTSELQSRRDLV